MKTSQQYLLAAIPLLMAMIVWAGCSLMNHPRETWTHDKMAGPAAIRANADRLPGTIVTPHLEGEIPLGKNVLWCATFQIAWNELCDLLGGPPQWPGAPEMVSVLNKKGVTCGDLDEASYVALGGTITNDSDDIRQKITRELERKFKGAASPELLHVLDTLSPGQGATYAYLFKELPFPWAFERMRRPVLTFAGRRVETFGIAQFLKNQENEVRAASQVFIYDYQTKNDFIVELKTRSEADRLILAKVPPGRTLAETIAGIQIRLRQSKPGPMQEGTNLFVPVLNFDVLRSYDELLQGPVAIAVQQIRFKLDERGAVLKSEALTARGGTDRNLVFDKPFLILIQRTDARQPYFALWVANAELLVPFHQTSSATSSAVK